MVDYVLPVAKLVGAECILQLGDWGFWEHHASGVNFHDTVDDAAARLGIPIYFLRGNHDKLSLLLKTYGRDVVDGFIRVRDNIMFIPDGHVWTWAGTTFRAFGGAYSPDKEYRLEQEAEYEEELRESMVKAGLPSWGVPSQRETQWFPEEELTDQQMAELLAQPTPKVHVMVTHDMPAGSQPWKDFESDPDAVYNQRRLKDAMIHHTPVMLLHGHLHHRYMTSVRSGGDSWTSVIGMGCDMRAAMRFARPTDAWAVLDLHDTLTIDSSRPPRVFIPGRHPSLDVDYASIDKYAYNRRDDAA